MEGVGDNVVQHVAQQIVESVHEITTTLPPVVVEVVSEVVSEVVPEVVSEGVSEVVSTIIEPVVASLDEIVTQAAASLVDEVTTQANIVADYSKSTIVDHVSTIVETVVQPLAEELPIAQEIPQVINEVPDFVVQPEIIAETISDKVTEFVTEATQEFTTLLSPDVDHVNIDEGNVDMTSGDHSSPKVLLTHDSVQWLHETRLILAITVSMVYLFTIFFIRRLLSKRSPFHLRNLLTLWNLAIAGFSVACSVILAHHMVPWSQENGIGSTICSLPINDSIRLWLNLFTWSKLLELGNTLFVVLRKQKLRFMHVYYHLSILIYTFYLFGGGIIASGNNSSSPNYYPAIVFINAIINGICYTYYIFRSRGCVPPKVLTLILNLIQMLQFFAIMIILLISMLYHYPSSYDKIQLPDSLSSLNLISQCSPSITTDIFGITVIGTNFILFVNHFRSNNVKPKTIKLL